MSGKKISDEELIESIKDSVDYLHSITSSDRFIELDEPQRILGKIGQTQKHVKSKKRILFFRIFGKRTVKEAIARFEIKQKQAFIRRKTDMDRASNPLPDLFNTVFRRFLRSSVSLRELMRIRRSITDFFLVLSGKNPRRSFRFPSLMHLGLHLVSHIYSKMKAGPSGPAVKKGFR